MCFLPCRWDFGDGSEGVIHTQSAPCQSMDGLVRGEKQVYVQDSVNHTYYIPGKHTLKEVHIDNNKYVHYKKKELHLLKQENFNLWPLLRGVVCKGFKE